MLSITNIWFMIVFVSGGILYHDAIGMLCVLASCPALYLVFKIIYLYCVKLIRTINPDSPHPNNPA